MAAETQGCPWCAEDIPADATKCRHCQGDVAAGRTYRAAKATESSRPKAPAGWYPDPAMVNTRRYWDGVKWTDHRVEASAPPPPAAPSYGPEEPSSGAVTLGLVTAVFIPFVGFFVGIALLNRRGNSGVHIIVLSVCAFIIWAAILSNGFATSTP